MTLIGQTRQKLLRPWAILEIVDLWLELKLMELS